jgi:hypothetical protein
MGLGFFFLCNPAARSGAPANGPLRTVAVPAFARRSREKKVTIMFIRCKSHRRQRGFALRAHEARQLASWRREMKQRLAARKARQLALREERGDLARAVAAAA